MIRLINLKISHVNSDGSVIVPELRLEPGELIHMAGLSGSGKSTVMEYLAGLIPGGTEADVESELSDNGFSNPFMVMQNVDSPFFFTSVREEIEHSLCQNSEEYSDDAVLEQSRIFGLSPLLERRVSDLSCGEKQKLYLTLALIRKADLLVLDEPTAYLDRESSSRVMPVLDDLVSLGTAVVVSNHKSREMKELDARLIGLEKGRLVFDSQGAGSVEVPDDFGLYPDAGNGGSRKAVTCQKGEKIMDISGLVFAYPETPPLFDNVNLSVSRGEWIHVLGSNGSGKTTLIRLILGRLKPGSGRIEKSRVRFGYLPQNYRYYAWHDTLMQEADWICQKNRTNRLREEYAESLGIENLFQRDLLYFSRGEAQRVFLFLALLAGPDILIMDEPSSGQDSLNLSRIMETLEKVRQRGCAIILISHEEWLSDRYADKVWEIKNGGIVCSDTASRI